MQLVEFETLAVGKHPLRHIYTGDRGIFHGLAGRGAVLVHFDDDDAVTQIAPSVMADATKPAPEPDIATEETGGYTRCVRCQDIYDVGPSDPFACPKCGPVTWEPEEIPAP